MNDRVANLVKSIRELPKHRQLQFADIMRMIASEFQACISAGDYKRLEVNLQDLVSQLDRSSYGSLENALELSVKLTTKKKVKA